MAEAQSDKEVFNAELERRLDEYCTTCRPGCSDSGIPPLTFMQYLPAVIISIILTILAIVVAVTYYPMT